MLQFLFEKTLQIFNVPFTLSFLKKEEKLHQYPTTLQCAADVLSSYQIDTLLVQIGKNELTEVPYPLWVQGKNQDISLLLSYDTNAHIVTILNQKNKIHQYSLDIFLDWWTGYAVLVSKTDNSAEPDYDNNQKQSHKKIVQNSLLFGLLGLVWVGLCVFSFLSGVFFIYLLKSIGVFLSVLLVGEYLSLGNSFAQNICQWHKKTSCESVLHSKAGSFWGVSMTELGLWYFLSGFLACIFAFVFEQHFFIVYLAYLNLIVLPYSIFSIYYQGFVIKKWCPLCLGVLLVFVGEFLVLFSFLFSVSFSLLSFVGFITLFLLVVILWYFIKPILSFSLQIEKLARQNNTFKRNKDVFNAILKSDNNIFIDNFPADIQGLSAEKHTLQIVTNPFCKPCQHLHQKVEKLLAICGDKIQVQFILSYAHQDAKKVCLDLLALSSQNINLTESFKIWSKNPTLSAWNIYLESKNRVVVSSDFELLLENMMLWQTKNRIDVTPSLFFDGYRFPDIYQLEDLRWLV